MILITYVTVVLDLTSQIVGFHDFSFFRRWELKLSIIYLFTF